MSLALLCWNKADNEKAEPLIDWDSQRRRKRRSQNYLLLLQPSSIDDTEQQCHRRRENRKFVIIHMLPGFVMIILWSNYMLPGRSSRWPETQSLCNWSVRKHKNKMLYDDFPAKKGCHPNARMHKNKWTSNSTVDKTKLEMCCSYHLRHRGYLI